MKSMAGRGTEKVEKVKRKTAEDKKGGQIVRSTRPKTTVQRLLDSDRGTFCRACTVGGRFSRTIALLEVTLLGHPGFDLVAAYVREHLAVDFDAGRQGLSALSHHLFVLIGIVDDVAIFEWEIVLLHDGATFV